MSEDAIIGAIQNAVTAMQEALRMEIKSVYFETSGICTRIEVLETDKAVRDAVACVEVEHEKEVKEKKKEIRGTWLYIVRGLALAGSLSLIAIVWKLVTITDGLRKAGILE